MLFIYHQHGDTALVIACRRNMVTMVHALVEEFTADVNIAGLVSASKCMMSMSMSMMMMIKMDDEYEHEHHDEDDDDGVYVCVSVCVVTFTWTWTST